MVALFVSGTVIPTTQKARLQIFGTRPENIKNHLLITSENIKKHLLITSENIKKHLLITSENIKNHLLVTSENIKKHLLITVRFFLQPLNVNQVVWRTSMLGDYCWTLDQLLTSNRNVNQPQFGFDVSTN